MLKIRRSRDRPIFNIGIPIPGKDGIYIETGPRTRKHGYIMKSQSQCGDKYSLLMHCIKIKSPAKFLLNEQYVFVGGNISFLCVLSCSSEEA